MDISLGLTPEYRARTFLLANSAFRVADYDKTAAICPNCGGRFNFSRSYYTFEGECERCDAFVTGELEPPFKPYKQAAAS